LIPFDPGSAALGKALTFDFNFRHQTWIDMAHFRPRQEYTALRHVLRGVVWATCPGPADLQIVTTRAMCSVHSAHLAHLAHLALFSTGWAQCSRVDLQTCTARGPLFAWQNSWIKPFKRIDGQHTVDLHLLHSSSDTFLEFLLIVEIGAWVWLIRE
jgi:hypothetical protein